MLFTVTHNILNLWFASMELCVYTGISMESPIPIKVELPFMITSAFPSITWMNRVNGNSSWDNTLPKSNANACITQLFRILMFFITMVLVQYSNGSPKLNVLGYSNSPVSMIDKLVYLFRPIFGVPLCFFVSFFLFRGFWGSCLVRFFLSFFFFWHCILFKLSFLHGNVLASKIIAKKRMK